MSFRWVCVREWCSFVLCRQSDMYACKKITCSCCLYHLTTPGIMALSFQLWLGASYICPLRRVSPDIHVILN